ncbi:hypothetical protein FNV43_RR10636 [Rhamnella rubrinervis]|uniref:Peripheral subunit-binding (PSBD) domain-containing protein n=1 Tax=Rhamnella rubrinervis TaxID=2594499 RepID=A0A8K0MH30_9ROSA|nr:hypothetical protein FNV43_RR10636 [Rhamnella rubrinervis]
MKSPPVAVASMHLASVKGKRIVASPYAKKLAKELKVDLGRVVGSGPLGRIVAKDVEAALSNVVEAAATVMLSAATGGARQQLRGLSWGRWFLYPQCRVLKCKELVDMARAKQLHPHEYNTEHVEAVAYLIILPLAWELDFGRWDLSWKIKVNVTADHRVIYCADLAAFLKTLASIIKDPKDLTSNRNPLDSFSFSTFKFKS